MADTTKATTAAAATPAPAPPAAAAAPPAPPAAPGYIQLDPALGLVKLIGLSVEERPEHKVVWEGLAGSATAATASTAQPQKRAAMLHYKLATLDDVIPARKAKPERQKAITEETSDPPGILKSNWIPKHLGKVPAVVVFFRHLEWEQDDFEEEQQQFADQVNALRSKLDGRPTRIVAVLLQEKILPDGHSLVDERAISLRKACLLTTKSSLFVLQCNGPRLRSMVIRLESAFIDLANQFYAEEEQKVRKHFDFLNRNTELMMSVRYHFKIGFYLEMRKDSASALKEYHSGYEALRKIRPDRPSRAHEIKAVAGILTSKICRLYFQRQCPLDSLAHFRQHLAHYRRLLGPQELLFLHARWMSEQHALFACLFSSAVGLGLSAITTEHPGFYFRSAARHKVEERQLCKRLCDAALADLPIQALEPVFVGQLAVVRAQEGGEPEAIPEEPEKDLVKAQALREPTTDRALLLFENAKYHFARVNVKRVPVPGTSGAKRQYTEVPLTRTVHHIDYEMAAELCYTGSFRRSARYIPPLVELYRREGWTDLLSNALAVGHKCAFAAGNVRDLTGYALELCGKASVRSVEEKLRLQAQLANIVSGVAVDGWASGKPSEDAAASSADGFVDMTLMVDAVACKVVLSPAVATGSSDSNVLVSVAFRSCLPNDVTLKNIRPVLSVGGPSATQESKTLVLPGGGATTMHTVACTTDVHVDDLHVDCLGIEASLDAATPIHLKWFFEGSTISSFSPSTAPKEPSELQGTPWKSIANQTSLVVSSRAAQVSMTLEHCPPALVQEVHKVTVRMSNEEAVKAVQPILSVRLTDEGEAALATGRVAFNDKALKTHEAKHQLDDISGHGTAAVELFVTFHARCSAVLHLSLDFTLENRPTRFSQVLSEPLTSIVPFKVAFRLQTSQYTRFGDVAAAGEPFLLLPEIRSLCPWPIQVCGGELKEDVPAEGDYPFLVPGGGLCGLQDLTISKGELACSTVCLSVPPRRAGHVSLGVLAINWSRLDAPAGSQYCTLYALPKVNVKVPAVTVKILCPSCGVAGQELQMSCHVANSSLRVQELLLSIEPNDKFMFSGMQKSRVRVPPALEAGADGLRQNVHVLQYNVVPLESGRYPLPALSALDAVTSEAIQVSGVRYVYIKPTRRP